MLRLAIVAAGALAALAVIGRPLLFSSLDYAVARAHGVPTRMLVTAFLVLLGLTVAETAQITGVLLVFALLVAPPATAQLITPRIGLSLMLSAALAVLVVWFGLALRVLLRIPGRLLRDQRRIRRIRARARVPGARAAPGASPRDRGGGRGGSLMLAHEFVRNALVAGTFIALACGTIGYFVVLRAQVFAGDALSHGPSRARWRPRPPGVTRAPGCSLRRSRWRSCSA